MGKNIQIAILIIFYIFFRKHKLTKKSYGIHQNNIALSKLKVQKVGRGKKLSFLIIKTVKTEWYLCFTYLGASVKLLEILCKGYSRERGENRKVSVSQKLVTYTSDIMNPYTSTRF